METDLAPFFRAVSRRALGADCGDGHERLASVPRGAVRWNVNGPASRSTGRGVHVCCVVSRWAMDVLHGNTQQRVAPVAPALPGQGIPEQLTSGINQERGVVVDSDGQSVITSLGAHQSAIWFRGPTGDRPISVEGYSYRPVMSPAGSKVFYLVRRAARRSFSIGELWATDLQT